MSKKYILIVILFFGFLIRFIYFLKNPNFHYTHLEFGDTLPSEVSYFTEYHYPRDSQEYKLLALNLVKEGKFSWNSEPVTFRTPIYPLFISSVYSLFPKTQFDESYNHPGDWLVMLFQVFLSTASIYLIYLLGKSFSSDHGSASNGNELAGIAAASLFLIDFNSIFFSSIFMAETLFVFLLLLGTFLFLKSRTSFMCEAGLIFGILALTRPIALYIFIPLLFFQRGLKSRLLFLFFFFLPIFPWMLRNYIVYRSPQLTSIQGYDLLFCNALRLEMAKSGATEEEVSTKFINELGDSSNNPLVLAGRAQKIAVKCIMRSPFRYILFHLKDGIESLVSTKSDLLVMRMSGVSTPQFRFYQLYNLTTERSLFFKFIVVLLGVVEIFLVLVSLSCGVVSVIRNHHYNFLLFLSIVIYFFIISGGPYNEARFRFPMMPYFYILSGSVIASFIMKRKNQGSGFSG